MYISERFIQETLVFSKKPVVYNIEAFRKNNIIMVIGLSGAGKSTLSKKLAKKMNAKYISVDAFDRESWKKIDPEGKIAQEKYYEEWKKKWDEVWIPLRKSLLEEAKNKAKVVPVIIDGLQMLEPLDEVYGKGWRRNYCFIDIGTSMLKSFARGVKREPKDALKRPLRFIRQYFFGTNKDVEKRLKTFRKEMESYGVSISKIEDLEKK